MLFFLGNYNSFSVFPPFTFFLEIAKMMMLMEFLVPYRSFSGLKNKKMLSASRVLCRQAKVLMKKLMQGSDKSTYLRAC